MKNDYYNFENEESLQPCVSLKFKKTNYEYKARRIDTNELIIGYPINAIIDGQTNKYAHYMYEGMYNENDKKWHMHIEPIAVDENTIEPLKQTDDIKYILENGFNVKITDENKKIIAVIRIGDDIPYGLWDKQNNNKTNNFITNFFNKFKKK